MLKSQLWYFLFLVFAVGQPACESNPGDKPNDTDADADTDEDRDTDTDTDQDTDTNDDSTDCETFCQDIQAACPDDTKCLHSCETAPGSLSQANMDCAAAATTCDEANACWGGLY